MKLLATITFLLLGLQSFGQRYTLPDGEYMDATVNKDTACKDYNLYYYQVGGKYPKSSLTILNEVKGFLLAKNKKYEGSGYVTFRFKVDCNGNKMMKTQVLQTDENYKRYHFDKELVNELYLFLNTLGKWKTAVDKKGNSASYIAFITFKIRDGKVINIIP